MADESFARPQPIKHPALGALATLLRSVDEFGRKPFGYDNPPVAMMSDLVGLPAVHRTLERASRGAPLTSGTGWTTLPLQDTTQALFSAPGIAQGIGALGKVAGRGTLAGMNAIMADAAPAGTIPLRRLQQTGAIKPKGGNWLKGDVERSLSALKGDVMPGAYAGDAPANAAELRNARSTATNDWIDKQLTRYVKNEMGTPEDPIRALAESGILHVNPEELNFRPEVWGKNYMTRPGQQWLAQSPAAKAWEGVSDSSINDSLAGDHLVGDINGHKESLQKNPWLEKVPPETRVYSTEGMYNSDVGFTHLMDELRNAMNPASGLPPELLLKYSALNNVSVPQAVERVSKINAWRAAQQAEADTALANNQATFTHKEYPGTNMKWVQLKPPELEGMPDGAREILGDALKYEGDTMGHCVGGYCDDVASGATRIFSLRDGKGQPHVTIEVAPASQMPDEELLAQIRRREPFGAPSTHERMMQEARQPSIVQIKGKGNTAPAAGYLPYVQDFVRSGQWGNIGDLRNTGLQDISKWPERVKALGSRYVTDAEHNAYLDDALLRDLDDNAKGFAAGGAVHACTACSGHQDDFNQDLINEMAAQLHEELNGQ